MAENPLLEEEEFNDKNDFNMSEEESSPDTPADSADSAVNNLAESGAD